MVAPPLLCWADYQRMRGEDDAVITRALELHEEKTGAPMSKTDITAALSDYEGSILVIGSDADESSPLGLIRDLAASLPGAKLIERETLSHRDLALDPGILSDILAFLGY